MSNPSLRRHDSRWFWPFLKPFYLSRRWSSQRQGHWILVGAVVRRAELWRLQEFARTRPPIFSIRYSIFGFGQANCYCWMALWANLFAFIMVLPLFYSWISQYMLKASSFEPFARSLWVCICYNIINTRQCITWFWRIYAWLVDRLITTRFFGNVAPWTSFQCGLTYWRPFWWSGSLP